MEKNQRTLIKECEICKEDANSLCFKCNSYYCEQCFNYVHGKKNNSNHIKERIEPFVSIDLKCPEHKDHPMFLFCVEEKGKIYLN